MPQCHLFAQDPWRPRRYFKLKIVKNLIPISVRQTFHFPKDTHLLKVYHHLSGYANPQTLFLDSSFSPTSCQIHHQSYISCVENIFGIWPLLPVATDSTQFSAAVSSPLGLLASALAPSLSLPSERARINHLKVELGSLYFLSWNPSGASKWNHLE